MKALVTGATGFVGSHLAEALHAAGRRGDGAGPLAAEGRGARGRRACGWCPGTCTMPAALERAVEGQDIIYHVAGLVAARRRGGVSRGQPGRDREPARGGRAAQARPRFVLVSSLAAGGPAPRGPPLTGDEPPHPVTAYGRSKLAAEGGGSASSLPWTIVRPPIVYGPRDREVLKVFRLARLRRRPGVRRRLPGAVRGPRRRSGRGAGRRGNDAPRRSAAPTPPAIPRCSPAPSSAAPWRRHGSLGRHRRIPAPVGRGAARLTRPPPGSPARHHSHQRQGERVLPAGLDRRSRTADP